MFIKIDNNRRINLDAIDEYNPQGAEQIAFSLEGAFTKVKSFKNEAARDFYLCWLDNLTGADFEDTAGVDNLTNPNNFSDN
jgi:hypothetical protein